MTNLANLPLPLSQQIDLVDERSLTDGNTYSIQNVGDGIVKFFVGGMAAPALSEGQELTRRGDSAVIPIDGSTPIWVWAWTVDSELGIQDITA